MPTLAQTLTLISMTTIVWLRQDLRIQNNPALYHAAQNGPVIPLYILDDETPGKWKIASAQRWLLHHALSSLQKDLKKHNIDLILKSGNPQEVIINLIKETNANAVYWNRCYEPFAIKRDTQIKKTLKSQNIETQSFNGSLLFEPTNIQNKSGSYFKVFTPFWKHCLTQPKPNQNYKVNSLNYYNKKIKSDKLTTWKLLPTKPDWAGGFKENWNISEHAAKQLLTDFIQGKLNDYTNGRDIPSLSKTSLLSPYLHMGIISPHTIWHTIHDHIIKHPASASAAHKFLSELGWREFSYHLLYHFPDLPEKPFQSKFANFPWKTNKKSLKAWQQGHTGYPIVDAGMRQLWHTGYMHNRVRMIAASFLIKHLLIHWHEGQDWFWDTLLDADLANNAASWQWVAGSGADAAPYFRIFNPILQGKKFDPDGTYVKQWIPELKNCPTKHIHEPWNANTKLNYPPPIIDHTLARNRALNALKTIK